MWNLNTVLASKPSLPLARSDCKDGVISLDNIHDDVSVNVHNSSSSREITALVWFLNEC